MIHGRNSNQARVLECRGEAESAARGGRKGKGAAPCRALRTH